VFNFLVGNMPHRRYVSQRWACIIVPIFLRAAEADSGEDLEEGTRTAAD
jgi:hypothetical protein